MTALQGALRGFSSWSPEEDAILREFYERDGYHRACELLPNRSPASVFHRARKIGLSTHRRWTSSDEAKLRDLWAEGVRLKEIAKELGRTPATTYWRAQQLRLGLGCPAGYEYLTAAARRTGYDTGQLQRILRWAGVPIRMALARPVKAARRMHFVDPVDVDDAIERWHQTEPLHCAAQRVGVCSETLRRWLRAVGVEQQERGTRARWRVNAKDVERACAARDLDQRGVAPTLLANYAVPLGGN